MAKRMFAAILLPLMALAATGESQAQQMSYPVDGCAKLARVVYAEVAAAALYGPGNSGPWYISDGQGELAICKTVSKTVSKAFSSAMLSTGIPVHWRTGGLGNPSRGDGGIGPDRDDFCRSGVLSQCYPSRNPLDEMRFGISQDIVQKSWSVVSQVVMREMYNPFSSDEVRFRDEDLKLRLGLSLRAIGSKGSREFIAH